MVAKGNWTMLPVKWVLRSHKSMEIAVTGVAYEGKSDRFAEGEAVVNYIKVTGHHH